MIKYLTYFIFYRKFVEASEKFYDTTNAHEKKDEEKREAEELAFTEDDMSLLKRDIRLIEKKISDLEKERIESDEEKDAPKNQINKLKEEKKEKEEMLKEYQAKFKKRIHSVDLENLKGQVLKYGHQLKALDIVLPAWVALFLFIGACFAGAFSVVSLLVLLSEIESKLAWCSTTFVICFGLYLFTMACILYTEYKEVPHQTEWVMEWQGKFLCSLDPGYHFIFPLFCDLREEVSMVVIPIALFPEPEKEEDENEGKETDKVDFADDSASIVAELFMQIFDSYKSVYAVEGCLESTRKKMEAGLRAYFGPKELDEAIATRSDIDLRQIIIQPACQADIFKSWGVKIVDLAVRRIDLSKKTAELRQQNLEAKKNLDVAKINEKTAEIDAVIKETALRGSGAGLAALAKAANVSSREAIQFVIAEKKWKAGEKAKSLILTDSSDGNISSSALTGAAAAAGVNSINEPEEKTDKDKEKKDATPDSGKK